VKYLTFVSTAETDRRRFYSRSFDEALAELRRYFPVGKQVEQRLRNGETVKTDQYSIRVVKLVVPTTPKKQLTFSL